MNFETACSIARQKGLNIFENMDTELYDLYFDVRTQSLEAFVINSDNFNHKLLVQCLLISETKDLQIDQQRYVVIGHINNEEVLITLDGIFWITLKLEQILKASNLDKFWAT